MDSLSQIVLGAAVGEAVAGQKIGRKAPLIGAIFGTIPDFDIFLKYIIQQPVDQDLAHRGFSHSILFAVLIALIAIPIFKRIFKIQLTKQHIFFLCFLSIVTHPMLDIFTTWGTQFLWPLENRIALSSIFVIDPLYTLPFLILTIWAISLNKKKTKRRVLNYSGLVISTAYLLFTYGLKSYYLSSESMVHSGPQVVQHEVRPMPLTSLYWMSITEYQDKFEISYKHSLKDQHFKREESIEKNHHLIEMYLNKEEHAKIKFLSKGFYSAELKGDTLFVYDLKFGTLNKLTNGENKSPLMGYAYVLQQGGVSRIFKLSELQDFNDINFTAYLNTIF